MPSSLVPCVPQCLCVECVSLAVASVVKRLSNNSTDASETWDDVDFSKEHLKNFGQSQATRPGGVVKGWIEEKQSRA